MDTKAILSVLMIFLTGGLTAQSVFPKAIVTDKPDTVSSGFIWLGKEVTIGDEVFERYQYREFGFVEMDGFWRKETRPQKYDLFDIVYLYVPLEYYEVGCIDKPIPFFAQSELQSNSRFNSAEIKDHSYTITPLSCDSIEILTIKSYVRIDIGMLDQQDLYVVRHRAFDGLCDDCPYEPLERKYVFSKDAGVVFSTYRQHKDYKSPITFGY